MVLKHIYILNLCKCQAITSLCRFFQKLRLFDADTGHIFSTADSLDSVMQGEQGLLNGGSVILEYVDSDCDQLLDVDMYVKKT